RSNSWTASCSDSAMDNLPAGAFSIAACRTAFLFRISGIPKSHLSAMACRPTIRPCANVSSPREPVSDTGFLDTNAKENRSDHGLRDHRLRQLLQAGPAHAAARHRLSLAGNRHAQERVAHAAIPQEEPQRQGAA